MRTVIDYTSRLFIKEFLAGLCYANEKINLQITLSPREPISLDFLKMGSGFGSHDDYNASVEFAYTLNKKPYAESYALVLSALQMESTKINGVDTPIPLIPRIVWHNILTENPWVTSYIDSAGEIQQSCSRMIHGSAVSPVWNLADLDITLSTSTFSPNTQAGLRAYMSSHPATERFLLRSVS